ncbi:MAG: InlB B-repeat-containing protein [Methanomassiliicoccaceae archaeon]|nr:InlB B-repeat-containing protein [Methanomassiliicoccaceae archaeon]
MKKIVWYKIVGIMLCLTVVLAAAVIVFQYNSHTAEGSEYSISFITWGPGNDPDNLHDLREFVPSFDEQHVLRGGTCEDPGSPTDIPPGYDFSGWYATGEAEPFDFTKKVYGDLKLYAGFDRQWGTPVQAGDLAALKAAITAAADGDPVSIELTADITFTAAANTITVPANKIIKFTSADVPGAPFTIDAAGLGRVASVTAGGTLYLRDIIITGGNVTGSQYGGGVNNAGTLILNPGATVSDNKANSYGGGIYNTGIFIMNAGATVSGNTSNMYGGGISISGAAAEFTMNGGTISENKGLYGGGGGVYNSLGLFTMNGGEISGNSTGNGYSGGGVYNRGTFNMQEDSGGVPSVITGNKAAEGGGVYNYATGTVFNLFGGSISDNEASYIGGGVNNDGQAVINMSGGTISGNEAIMGPTLPPYNSGFGGGICNWWGTVTMSGGEIVGNQARFGGGVFNYLNNIFDMSGDAIISKNKGLLYQYSSGGGVYNYGFFTMYDNAAIIGNSATWGGGVFNEARRFTMEGGSVEGNSTVSGGGGGIYLNYSFDPTANIVINGGSITNNSTPSSGGGIWVSRAYLNKVTVAAGVVFSGNSAGTAYSRDPSDDATYYAQIGNNGEGVIWTDPFDQGYNNFDISYPGGTQLTLVTFMQNHSASDDTIFKIITVARNTVIGAQMPADPAWAGYEFAGWNASRDGTGTVYTDSSPVITTDTVVYAQWTPLPPTPPPIPPTPATYFVIYNGNGNTYGTAPVDGGRYLSGDSVTILGQSNMVKTDHVFLGWSVDPAATAATHIPGGSFRIYTNTTLYAVWQMAYIVTFVDWDNTVLKTDKVPYGAAAVAPPDPSREGYVFAGWDKPFDYITSDLVVKALYEETIGSPHVSGKGEWALLNLILALIGIVIAIVAVVDGMRKEKEREGRRDETAKSAGRSFAWMLVAAIAAVAGILFFIITEDMSLPMTFVDKWTVINAIIFVIVVIAAALAIMPKEGFHKVFKQNLSITGDSRAKSGSPYTFTVKGGYAGGIAYRIGEGGSWKYVFPDDRGIYTIPGEYVSDKIYLENHP